MTLFYEVQRVFHIHSAFRKLKRRQTKTTKEKRMRHLFYFYGMLWMLLECVFGGHRELSPKAGGCVRVLPLADTPSTHSQIRESGRPALASPGPYTIEVYAIPGASSDCVSTHVGQTATIQMKIFNPQ